MRRLDSEFLNTLFILISHFYAQDHLNSDATASGFVKNINLSSEKSRRSERNRITRLDDK